MAILNHSDVVEFIRSERLHTAAEPLAVDKSRLLLLYQQMEDRFETLKQVLSTDFDNLYNSWGLSAPSGEQKKRYVKAYLRLKLRREQEGR
jgi:hypothetical protein